MLLTQAFKNFSVKTGAFIAVNRIDNVCFFGYSIAVSAVLPQQCVGAGPLGNPGKEIDETIGKRL